ncbi:MAG: ATP-dependent RNA helicase RhlB [Verrucomicrobia bacterium]|nr:ATP-dependent RNA helicase RhlB [Verrucomicrobiota bacterium]
MKYCAVYGGMDYGKQERELTSGPVDVIAATPGRLLDFAGRKKLSLDAVEVLVIDEADRMLDMGFIPDIKRIIRLVPSKEKRQTLLFSATLSDDVMRLASAWMPNPQTIEITPEKVEVDTVQQIVYIVTSKDKGTLLCNLLKRPAMERVLVFTNRRDEADYLAKNLQKHGIKCGLLSGAVDQAKRIHVLEAFRSGRCHVVVATDVAARGLHIDAISHVINFDLPYEAEDYVHRIGRTARAGAAGIAISFACEEESFVLPEIEKFIGHPLPMKQPEEDLLVPLR